MKVAKFGGSSLASYDQIKKVCEIITSDKSRRLIVVSAPGRRFKEDTKVTDLLIQAATSRLSGSGSASDLEPILERYREIAEGFGVSAMILPEISRQLQLRFEASTENAGRYLDGMKAAGEDNNARLVAAILRKQGYEASYVHPGEAGMMLSDEAGNARVLPESYAQLAGLKDRPGTLIFPGFFGQSNTGHIVTFPRGGSDITGAILAAAVNAEVYENFTDVDSVLAANPMLVEDPVPISLLTYREMRELSYAGFSVFHDEALEPVYDRGIPVHVRNTNNPSSAGTRIVKDRPQSNRQPVVGIAASGPFCSFYIDRYLMNREVGYGRRVLQVFEEEGISFEHAPSGIDNISIIVKQEGLTPEIEERIVARMWEELDADQVSLERGIGLIMIVGEGMRHSIGITARAGAAFAKARVNLEMINQGSSEVSMMFGVKEDAIPRAVQALYEEFFEPRKD